MNKTNPKVPAAKQTPTPALPLHQFRPTVVDAPAKPVAPKKRENIFSKSRDIREDRGTRQMKSGHNPKTSARGAARGR